MEENRRKRFVVEYDRAIATDFAMKLAAMVIKKNETVGIVNVSIPPCCAVIDSKKVITVRMEDGAVVAHD